MVGKYLRDAKGLSIRGIFDQADCLGCEDRFIKVDDLIILLLKISKLLLQIKPPLFILILFLWINPLNELDIFAFDFILLIELGK